MPLNKGKPITRILRSMEKCALGLDLQLSDRKSTNKQLKRVALLLSLSACILMPEYQAIFFHRKPLCRSLFRPFARCRIEISAAYQRLFCSLRSDEWHCARTVFCHKNMKISAEISDCVIHFAQNWCCIIENFEWPFVCSEIDLMPSNQRQSWSRSVFYLMKVG